MQLEFIVEYEKDQISHQKYIFVFKKHQALI